MFSAVNFTGYVQREFRLSPSLVFEPRISIISGRYFANGTFSINSNGDAVFSKMPDHYQQNRLDITSVRIPLLVKYELFKSSSGEGIAIGAGPYFDVMTNMRQRFKSNGNDYSQRAPIDKHFHAGIAVDFGTSGKINKIHRLGFGAGLQYQLTDYLSHNPSFQPMVFYLRLGFRF